MIVVAEVLMLYSMVSDLEEYAYIGFDREEIHDKFGDDIREHIDLTYRPISYLDSWVPISVSLYKEEGGITGDKVADIMPFQGKLFLSQVAYELLHPLIETDGEFLPVEYEDGNGYIFNPLSLAENVKGLDTKKSVKNGLRDVEAMAFFDVRVSQFMIFKTEFDNYVSMICQTEVKDAIEQGKLGGVIFSKNLAANYTGI